MWNWIFCIFWSWVYTIAECRMFCLHIAKHLDCMKSQFQGLSVHLVPCLRVSFPPSGCETPFDISSRSEHKISCLHRGKEMTSCSVFPQPSFTVFFPNPLRDFRVQVMSRYLIHQQRANGVCPLSTPQYCVPIATSGLSLLPAYSLCQGGPGPAFWQCLHPSGVTGR